MWNLMMKRKLHSFFKEEDEPKKLVWESKKIIILFSVFYKEEIHSGQKQSIK